ncbi:MAG: efflux RND transporter periplasmic adaptor subunit, partial [Kiritimatiellae bacterium]|nr:efflux RND transporter periplasmic adaptor subunit [Kiritimatiellia bacterium]
GRVMVRARAVSLGLMMMATSGLLFAQTEFSGLVEPFRDVLLSSTVPGPIARLPFREGDRVEKGDVLLELAAQVEELEVRRRTAIFEDESELLAARERSSLLEDELESTRDLAERTGSGSREELNRKQLETVLAKLEIVRLEQRQELQQIELQMARERLAQQKISAPFAGVLAQIPLDEGESVQPNQPAMRLVDDEQAFLVVNIPAERARSLELGQTVRLRFLVKDGLEKIGEVAFLSPVVDPASGLRRVKMRFENRDPKVEPGISGLWIVGDGHE